MGNPKLHEDRRVASLTGWRSRSGAGSQKGTHLSLVVASLTPDCLGHYQTLQASSGSKRKATPVRCRVRMSASRQPIRRPSAVRS